MSRNLFLILSLISLNSCYESLPKSWDWGLKARPLTGVRGFPETNTDYGKGFKSGCETGFESSSKGLKDLHKPKLNSNLMSTNQDYSTGWWDGFEQCTYIMDWDVL